MAYVLRTDQQVVLTTPEPSEKSSWVSSNPSVATVAANPDGLGATVVAQAEGETTISAGDAAHGIRIVVSNTKVAEKQSALTNPSGSRITVGQPTSKP